MTTAATPFGTTACQWVPPTGVPAPARRTVSEWEELLQTMQRKNLYRQSMDITYFKELNVWLPLDVDDDLVTFHQALTNNPHIFELFVWLPFGFMETSTHLLAECIARNHIHTVHLDVDNHNCAVLAIAEILYLEGNRPCINPLYPGLKFHLECLRLKHNDKKLHCFSLTKIPFTTDLVAFGNALHGNTELKSLSIGDSDYGNSYGASAAEASALAAGIISSQISKISLGKYCDTELFQAILRDGIQSSGRLFDLTVSGFYLVSRALTETLPSLKALRTRCYKDLPFEIADLCERLAHEATSLTSLDLDNCRLGDGNECMRALAKLLNRNRSIKELALCSNRIDDDAIEAFVMNWHDDSQLESLDLHNNDFGPKGVQTLMTAVAKHHGMKELNLGGCSNLGHEGFQLIAQHLPHLTLRKLAIRYSLDTSPLTDPSEKAIQEQEAIKVKTCNAMLDGIKENYFLHTLDMSGNGLLGGNVGWEIEFHTTLNEKGRHLLLDINQAPLSVWPLILAKCAKNDFYHHSLMYYFLVEQPMLVRLPSKEKTCSSLKHKSRTIA